MALAFDATVQGASANAYITEAQASAYLDGRLNADAWANASTGARQRALVSATSRLEQLQFLGYKTTTTQRLAWPRAQVRDAEGLAYYDSTAIPRALLEATAELALTYLDQGGDPYAGDDLAGVTSLSLGPVSLTRSAGAEDDLPRVVRSLLAGLTGTGGGTFRLVRT